MIRKILMATGLSAVVFAVGASGAFATTATIGQLAAPNINCVGTYTYMQTGSPSNVSYVIPFDGVITSWSWEAGSVPDSGLKLKVAHAVGGGQFVIDAEAAAGSQTPNAANAYPANIPVKAGDIIGISQDNGPCVRMEPGYSYVAFAGDVPPSSTPLTPNAGDVGFSIPVQATVTQAPTGQRATALKHCKKKFRHNSTKRRKCMKKAILLPV